MEIYIGKDGQVLGPYREGEIHTRLEDGSFDGAELACHGGLDKWVSLQELGELNETIKEDQPAHEVDLKRMEQVVELMKLQKTIEEERIAHGRAIGLLDAEKGAEIAKLNEEIRRLEETNCIMSQKAESLQANFKEYEEAFQSSSEKTISFQRGMIQDQQAQIVELTKQVAVLEAEQMMADHKRISQAEAEKKEDT